MIEKRSAPRSDDPSAGLATSPPPAESGRLRLDSPDHRLLQDWKVAHVRAVAYLAALGVPVAERDALAREAVARAVSAEPWDEGSDRDRRNALRAPDAGATALS